MPMRTSSYGEIRDLVLPGDVIGFLGNNPLSQMVAGGAGVSHVGVILEAGTAAREPRFVESSVHTVDNKRMFASGVLVSSFRTCVDDYAGAVWWLPLAPAVRAAFDGARFAQFIAGVVGDHFDLLGGLAVVLGGIERKMEAEVLNGEIEIAPHLLPELRLHVKKAYCCSALAFANRLVVESAKRLQVKKAYCCSALVANALQAAGIVDVEDPFAVDPSSVCSWRVYDAEYHRLKNTDRGDAEIHGYNSRVP